MAASLDFSKLFIREYEMNDGVTVLRFHQSEIGDVGCVVWDAALALSKYLETPDFSCGRDLKEKVVVELGSGTGAVGLVAASLGAHVTVTDLPDFVPLMDYNIADNTASVTGAICATDLTWGQPQDEKIPTTPDLILLADCIYYEESLEPLVRTIHSLCGPSCRVLSCHEARDTGKLPQLEEKFFKLMGVLFSVEEIPQERHDPEFSCADIHIFEFKLKENSV